MFHSFLLQIYILFLSAYRLINHAHNNNFLLLTIPIHNPCKKFARKTNPWTEFPPSFRYKFISSLLKKGVGSSSPFRFHFRKHEAHSRHPLCLLSTLPSSSSLSSFPFRNRSGLKGGSVQSDREISHCSISKRTCVQHIAPLNYPRLTKGRGSPLDR